MNTLVTILGYLCSVGAVVLQGYLIKEGYGATEALAAGGAVAAAGSRLLQQAAPQGKEVFPK